MYRKIIHSSQVSRVFHRNFHPWRLAPAQIWRKMQNRLFAQPEAERQLRRRKFCGAECSSMSGCVFVCMSLPGPIFCSGDVRRMRDLASFIQTLHFVSKHTRQSNLPASATAFCDQSVYGRAQKTCRRWALAKQHAPKTVAITA